MTNELPEPLSEQKDNPKEMKDKDKGTLIIMSIIFLFFLGGAIGMIISDHMAVDRAKEYMAKNCVCDKGEGYDFKYQPIAMLNNTL